MEPNELRIGNYVSQGNKQGSVKAILNYDLNET